ncbi:MAG: signal peptide peptidase SppA [Elusimicrobia bacterium]|nr:signal peptide peptidase SppA [Elusimicrobiota bacterium]
MQNKKIVETAVFLLLLLSVLSAVYLTIQKKIDSAPRKEPFNKVKIGKASPSIGLVEIYGEISSPYQDAGFFSQSGLPGVLETMKDFREDKDIKGVILRINSPGGTIGATQEITSEIQRLRKQGKPVVASISDIGASGGYYIASACDRIVANSGSIVGSIGVIMMTANMSDLLKKIGVELETVKSGPYKDVGSIGRPLSAEERKFLQELIDDAYDQFVVAVSSGRKMSVQEVKKVAQGQIYTGRMAKENRLIDDLGDLNTAKAVIEELTGTKNAKIVRKSYSKWRAVLRFIEKKSLPIDLGQKRFSGIAYLYRP